MSVVDQVLFSYPCDGSTDCSLEPTNNEDDILILKTYKPWQHREQGERLHDSDELMSQSLKMLGKTEGHSVTSFKTIQLTVYL